MMHCGSNIRYRFPGGWIKYILEFTFLIMSIVTFIAFAIDYLNAVKNCSRIRIVTLLALSFIGSSIGGLAAMYLFKHKTQKDYFTVGHPMILITQIMLLFYLINV